MVHGEGGERPVPGVEDLFRGDSALNTWAMALSQRQPKLLYDAGRLFWKKGVHERGHIVSESFELPVGESASLRLRNPEDTELTTFVTKVEVSTNVRVHSYIWENFDGEITGGEEVHIDNLLMDVSGPDPAQSGSMLAERDVDFTGIDIHSQNLIGGGRGGQTVGGTETMFAFGMEPDRDIVVEAQNDGDSDGNCVIEIVYYEVDELYSEAAQE